MEQISIKNTQQTHKNQQVPLQSLEQIQLEQICRKQFREHRSSTISTQILMMNQSLPRSNQGLFCYFYSLFVLLSSSIVQFKIFTDLGNDLELREYLSLALFFTGLVVSLVSNRMLASWKEILILYFHLDSIVPVFLSAAISYYAWVKFFPVEGWQGPTFLIIYPTWVVYLTGNLRVMLLYAKWQKWQVIFFKLTIICSGLTNFMIGYEYMMGKYKIFNGYYLYTDLEQQLKELTYLYVFGTVQLNFQMFRTLSLFDQTDQLKYQYILKDPHHQQQTTIIEGCLKQDRQIAQQEELQELIQEHLKRGQNPMSEDIISSIASSSVV